MLNLDSLAASNVPRVVRLPPPPGFTPPTTSSKPIAIPSLSKPCKPMGFPTDTPVSSSNKLPPKNPPTLLVSTANITVPYPNVPIPVSSSNIPPKNPPPTLLVSTANTTVPHKVNYPNIPTLTPSKPSPLVSILNPIPVPTKPAPNYKIDTRPVPGTSQTTHNSLFFTNNASTKSILRDPLHTNLTPKSAGDSRVVSFDLEPKLTPKRFNPSMPNLTTNRSKNPFLDWKNGDEADIDFSSDESVGDDDLVPNPQCVTTLGENFFASLFSTTNSTNNETIDPTLTDPWSQGQTSQSTPKMGSNPNPQFAPLTPGNAKTNQVPPSVTSMNSETPSGGAFASVKSQEDRYSALKELDEIFKSTVVMSDGEYQRNSVKNTTFLTEINRGNSSWVEFSSFVIIEFVDGAIE